MATPWKKKQEEERAIKDAQKKILKIEEIAFVIQALKAKWQNG
ncbi:MAG: hypothetical protein ABIJ83_01240 [Patescibacteria group bacterium]